MLIHPEGQPYYYRDTGLKIVTEASINRSEVWDKLSEWISGIEGALQCKGISPAESMELFLQPHENWETCGYYLANHATRSLFWLDQVSSELIGYDGNTSFSHLSAYIPLTSVVPGTEKLLPLQQNSHWRDYTGLMSSTFPCILGSSHHEQSTNFWATSITVKLVSEISVLRCTEDWQERLFKTRWHRQPQLSLTVLMTALNLSKYSKVPEVVSVQYRSKMWLLSLFL